MTDPQLFALFAPAHPMPLGVHERILRRVLAEVRRQRFIRRARRVVVLALVALAVWLFTSQAGAQVAIEPYYLPLIMVAEAE